MKSSEMKWSDSDRLNKINAMMPMPLPPLGSTFGAWDILQWDSVNCLFIKLEDSVYDLPTADAAVKYLVEIRDLPAGKYAARNKTTEAVYIFEIERAEIKIRQVVSFS